MPKKIFMEKNEYINIKKLVISIVGTTRNCENSLKSFDTLKSSLGEVRKIQFLFIESDSDDDTRNVLKNYPSKMKIFNIFILDL